MNEEQAQRINETFSNNDGYANSTALKLRLDTDPVLNRIEMNLRGIQHKIVINKAGEPQEKFEVDGESMANDIGVQNIMGMVRSMVNSQVVQGNFEEEEYGLYLCRQRKALVTDMMINLHRYDIDIQNYNGIIAMIFQVVEPFISRTKGNKERESYANTIVSHESSNNSVRQGKGVNLPFGSHAY